MKWRWIAFAGLLVATLGGVEVVDRLQRRPAPQGAPAPDFTLNAMDGPPLTLSSLKGRVVAVNFWATWCPPCKAEIPDFAALYAANAGKCLEVVGVAGDSGTRDEVAAAARELGINYPVLLDDDGKVGESYHVAGYPMTFLVDAGGRLRKTFDGAVFRPELEAALAPLLAEAPAQCPRRN